MQITELARNNFTQSKQIDTQKQHSNKQKCIYDFDLITQYTNN
jgi:hypothetical protein